MSSDQESQNWLGDLHLFVALAKARSFKRAAVALDMPQSTLSRRFKDFEKRIGIRLLNRTTRLVELTECGAHYFVRAERLVEDARVAHEDLRDHAGRLAGLVRVSMPASVVWRLAVPWIAEFLALYPEIELEVDTSPDHTDPVAEHWDICVHDNPLPDSSLTLRCLGTFKRSLFASPGYAAAHGLPTHPYELHQFDCLLAGRSPDRTTWRMSRGLERVSVGLTSRLVCGNFEFSPLFALEGLGIAAAVTSAYSDLVRQGRLVHVLPEWQIEPLVISAVMPGKLIPARTRVFLEFLAEKMGQVDIRIGYEPH